MYKSITTADDNPQFDRADFEYVVLDYYSRIIPRYSKHYIVDFYYYDLLDESMCLTNNCNGVEITIDCKLNVTYTYHRVMFYELRENNNG